MTNKLRHAIRYAGMLAGYVGKLGLQNGILMLVSLVGTKVGVKPKADGVLLLETWTVYQSLRGESQIRVTGAKPDELCVSYLAAGNTSDEVPMTLRMPASRSSDSAVFEQIFVRREYLHVLKWFARVRGGEIVTILDLGANIGCAALFFSAVLPGAKIYCLEPEESNYARLEKNLAMNPSRNIQCERAAIWSRTCALRCIRDFRDGRESAFRFVESIPGENAPAEASGVDIQTVADRAGFRPVDLLKLDVEGAEAELLREPAFVHFLKSSVRRIAVEVHEEFIAIEEARRVLDSVGFETSVVDEFVVGIKRSLV